jgi:hypothetical protein
VMGFCPKIWGLPMLHHTTLLNGYLLPLPDCSSSSITEARRTISPRTAYSACTTRCVMVAADRGGATPAAAAGALVPFATACCVVSTAAMADEVLADG